jgi:hypothetical protein
LPIAAIIENSQHVGKNPRVFLLSFHAVLAFLVLYSLLLSLRYISSTNLSALHLVDEAYLISASTSLDIPGSVWPRGSAVQLSTATDTTQGTLAQWGNSSQMGIPVPIIPDIPMLWTSMSSSSALVLVDSTNSIVSAKQDIMSSCSTLAPPWAAYGKHANLLMH